eukprot:IDg22387t1
MTGKGRNGKQKRKPTKNGSASYKNGTQKSPVRSNENHDGLKAQQEQHVPPESHAYDEMSPKILSMHKTNKKSLRGSGGKSGSAHRKEPSTHLGAAMTSGKNVKSKTFKLHGSRSGTMKMREIGQEAQKPPEGSALRLRESKGSSNAPSLRSGRSNRTQADPGVTNMIEDMFTIIDSSGESITDEVKALVKTLFRSSPYWSEDSIAGIYYRDATNLVVALSRAGIVKMDGTSAYQVLIQYHRNVTNEEKETKRLVKLESKTPYQKSLPKKELTLAQQPAQPAHHLVDTGRLDYRGMKIYSRERVISAEDKPVPDVPSSSSNSSDDDDYISGNHDKNMKKQQKEEHVSSFVKHNGGGTDPSESSSSEQGGKRDKKHDKNGRKKKNPIKDHKNNINDNSQGIREDKLAQNKLDMGSTMKLATSFLMKNEHKWSGPRDRFFTAEEYVRHYAHIMDMCDATTRIRMIFLPFAFKDDALEEFNTNFRDQVKQGIYRNASGVIREISQQLE